MNKAFKTRMRKPRPSTTITVCENHGICKGDVIQIEQDFYFINKVASGGLINLSPVI